MPNPYLALLDEAVGVLLHNDAEEYARSLLGDEHTHWDQDNEWLNTHLAGHLMACAYAWQEPQSKWYRDSWLSEHVVNSLRLLVDRGADDRWWHLDGRKGDPNIDRFTLLPFMEAFNWARIIIPLPLQDAALARINGVLDRQLAEYGQTHEDDQPYPNMDVYYCLLMLLAAELTGRPECRAEYERFLGLMEAAQFPEGGWTYFRWTNECPVYHDIAVMLLARVWALTGDQRARAMVCKSVPYYPQIVDPTGRPEYFTDCWWKHYWASPQQPYAPDTVASLSGDAANRALGELLRSQRGLRDKPWDGQVELPSIVHAALVWEDVEPDEGAPYSGIFLDANIAGPRGKFADWSWAATARYGSDTLVGAVAHTPAAEPPVALMAVTPEIEGRHEGQADHDMWRFALGITPPGTEGQTTIAPDRATFTAEYRMATFRGIWGSDYFPYEWQCRQVWEMDERALRGELTITSLADQQCPPPRVKVRLGRHLPLEQVSADEYVCGPFRLRVQSDDLPRRTVHEAQAVFCVKARDAVELLLELAAEPAGYVAGQTFRAQVSLEFAGPVSR